MKTLTSILVFIVLIIYPAYASSDTWVDEDGQAVVSFEDNKVSITSLSAFYYFDTIFDSAGKGEVVILSIGMGGADGMASDLVVGEASVSVGIDGKARTITFDTAYAEFKIFSAEKFLRNGEKIKVSIDNEDLFAAYTLSKDYELTAESSAIYIANKDLASISPEGIAFLEKNFPADPQTIQEAAAFKDNMGFGGISIWQLIIFLVIVAITFFFLLKFTKTRVTKNEIFSEANTNSKNRKTKMTIVEAVKSYFIKWNDFSSRASRSEYWWALLVLSFFGYFVGFGVGFIIAFALSAVGFSPNAIDSVVGISVLVWVIFSVIAGTSLVVRRLHDVDRSGWWFLIYFTIIGIVPLLIWFCTKGTAGGNRYGEDPLGSSTEYDESD